MSGRLDGSLELSEHLLVGSPFVDVPHHQHGRRAVAPADSRRGDFDRQFSVLAGRQGRFELLDWLVARLYGSQRRGEVPSVGRRQPRLDGTVGGLTSVVEGQQIEAGRVDVLTLTVANDADHVVCSV